MIERALARGVSHTVVYAGDGEGFDLYVTLSEEGLSSDSPPYGEGPRKEGFLPHKRVRKELAQCGLRTPILMNGAETPRRTSKRGGPTCCPVEDGRSQVRRRSRNLWETVSEYHPRPHQRSLESPCFIWGRMSTAARIFQPNLRPRRAHERCTPPSRWGRPSAVCSWH